MKSSLRIFLLVALAFVVAWAALAWYGPASWRYHDEVERSQPYIAQVEAFIEAHGRVPSNTEVMQLWEAADLEVSQACPCYDARGMDAYVVWVGGTLGTSYVYDSETGEWSEQG